MIKIKSNGKYTETAKFLKSISGSELINTEQSTIYKYGDDIVRRLQDATPRDTGKTASSWSYKVTQDDQNVRLNIYNSNISDGGACVAILLQYGHGTPSGTYVQGIDYINPAVRPYFDKIEEVVWKEVAK